MITQAELSTVGFVLIYAFSKQGYYLNSGTPKSVWDSWVSETADFVRAWANPQNSEAVQLVTYVALLSNLSHY